jgi:hypothetical protein
MAQGLGLRVNTVRNFLDPVRRKIYGKTFGPVVENGCWRRRTSEIYDVYDEYDVEFIEIGRFRWTRRVLRTEESDPAKKVLVLNQEQVETEEETDQS